jgi:hypothetical protein
VHDIQLAGTLLVPFPEQGDGVLHHNALLFRAFEAKQPVLSIALPLVTKDKEIPSQDLFPTRSSEVEHSTADMHESDAPPVLISGMHRNATLTSETAVVG